MLFDEDDIRDKRRALARGDCADSEPMASDLGVPDGVFLVSDRQRMADEFIGRLRSCDFGNPEDEAELIMRVGNLLVADSLDDDEEEVKFCVWRTLDFFSVTSFVLFMLLRGMELDNRTEFYDHLEVCASEHFADALTPWFEDEGDTDDSVRREQ